MSRFQRLDVADWDPALRDAVHGDAMPAIARGVFDILAHRPAVARAMAAYFAALKEEQTLPDRLLELVRLRVAFHNQCRTCMAIRYQDGLDDGVTEDLVCSLEKPAEAPDLTEAERAALAYADRVMTNHLSIDDSVLDGLRRHFDEGQLVELNAFLAASGFGRMAAIFHMVEDLPEHFRGDSGTRLAPWTSPHVVVGAPQQVEA